MSSTSTAVSDALVFDVNIELSIFVGMVGAIGSNSDRLALLTHVEHALIISLLLFVQDIDLSFELVADWTDQGLLGVVFGEEQLFIIEVGVDLEGTHRPLVGGVDHVLLVPRHPHWHFANGRWSYEKCTWGTRPGQS